MRRSQGEPPAWCIRQGPHFTLLPWICYVLIRLFLSEFLPSRGKMSPLCNYVTIWTDCISCWSIHSPFVSSVTLSFFPFQHARHGLRTADPQDHPGDQARSTGDDVVRYLAQVRRELGQGLPPRLRPRQHRLYDSQRQSQHQSGQFVTFLVIKPIRVEYCPSLLTLEGCGLRKS